MVLATHEESGTHVAIKYLSEDLRGRPGFLDRFQEEARLLVELEDPHVVQFYEYVQSDRGDAAIVMELVDGHSLRTLLERHGPTGPEAALAVLRGSLLGLAAAHAAGVVHRDYKPENVLVGADGTSKIADFGIALRTGGTGTAPGTPPYMAPEQWAGRPASAQSDVYAATIVFFECLTGHRPYRATERAVLMHQHQTLPPPLEEVPGPLRDLVARGLAKDPEIRPSGAEPFAAELEEAAASAYGADWEERGRRRLAALVAMPATPSRPRPDPSYASASLASTALRPLRGSARRTAVGVGLVAATGGIVAFALASADHTPAGSPPAAAMPGGRSEYRTAPSPSAQMSPGVSAEVSPTVSSGGDPEPSPPPPDAPASTNPPRSPVTSTSKPASPRPSRTPSPSRSPSASSTPTRSPSASPSASATSPRPTGVISVRLRGVFVSPLTPLGKNSTVAGGTVQVTTDGTGPVRLIVRFKANGAVVATRTATLKGARAYSRLFRHRFATQPCGGTVAVTASTRPASANGVSSSRVRLLPCPPKATGLPVG
ncbi:hypothetical protein GCM10022226_55120 [Sphaerisporangium flaviroseum]|uniref:non-specific serine/threonine protein kinase n=1 Tax=Sphaerisporangium flaviroseum TaxID=509199 RepID=A0ABP7IUD0_9ACTN